MTDTILQSDQPYTKLDALTTAIEFGTVMLSLTRRLEAALADVEADKLKLASVIDRVRAQEDATNKLRASVGKLSIDVDNIREFSREEMDKLLRRVEQGRALSIEEVESDRTARGG